MKSLTTKQKKFCEYYVSNAEVFGNGVQAYALAYGYNLKDPAKYKSAKSNAHKLLSDPIVLEYIDKLLQEQQLNKQYVDKQLGFLIQQNANLTVKRQAIADYYKFRTDVPEQCASCLETPKEEREWKYPPHQNEKLFNIAFETVTDPDENQKLDAALDMVCKFIQRVEDIAEGKYPITSDQKKRLAEILKQKT